MFFLLIMYVSVCLTYIKSWCFKWLKYFHWKISLFSITFKKFNLHVGSIFNFKFSKKEFNLRNTSILNQARVKNQIESTNKKKEKNIKWLQPFVLLYYYF